MLLCEDAVLAVLDVDEVDTDNVEEVGGRVELLILIDICKCCSWWCLYLNQ